MGGRISLGDYKFYLGVIMGYPNISVYSSVGEAGLKLGESSIEGFHLST